VAELWPKTEPRIIGFVLVCGIHFTITLTDTQCVTQSWHLSCIANSSGEPSFPQLLRRVCCRDMECTYRP
jgi:hypothetical protein